MNEWEELILGYIRFWATGREKAVKEHEIFQNLLVHRKDHPPFRKFRKIVAALPVCSCEKGLYIPTKTEEVEAFRVYLRKKALALFDRYKRVAAAYPKLSPDAAQLELRF